MFRGMRPPGGNNVRLYEVLGVSRDVTPEDLKRSYKKLAFVNHPDKGGDPEKFKEIANAFAVLVDPDQRQGYDTYGEEGIKEGMGASHARNDGGAMEDLLSQLFRGRGGSPMDDFFGGGFARSKRRGENVVQRLRVPLEDLYTGSARKISITRQVVCVTCSGTGSKSQRAATCLGCSGSGVRVVRIRLAHGIAQQVQSVCSQCQGSGEAIPMHDICPKCSGAKVAMEKSTVEVAIDRGMQSNQKIVIKGAANEAPGTIPGDVVVVIQEAEHPRFKRKGHDLVVEHKLSLLEALCGFSFILKHLDGRQLLIKSDPGAVIKPGDTKVIRQEGMPLSTNSFQKGSLFIHFIVKFPAPSTLTTQQCTTLESVFSGQRKVVPLEDLFGCEEVHFEDTNMSKEGTSGQESEDEGYGNERVNCAQQ